MSTIHPDATITIAEARDNLSDLYNRAAYGQERILLTRHGKGQVALIPVEDLEELEALEDMVNRELLRQAREENEREGTVPWEDVKAELELLEGDVNHTQDLRSVESARTERMSH